jgi:hypothetical protein
MSIEILNYRKIQNGSAILAEFSLKIPKWHIILHKIKHMKGKNGGEFVTGPSEKYVDKEGKTKYARFWQFEDRETDDRFQKEVRRTLDEFLADNPETPVQTTMDLDEEIPF